MYYISSHLSESGGQLLITSLTHNKIIVSSSTVIVLQYNLTEHFSLIKLTLITTQCKHHIDDIHLHQHIVNIFHLYDVNSFIKRHKYYTYCVRQHNSSTDSPFKMYWQKI